MTEAIRRPNISEHPFQIFCYGRFLEPANGKELTGMQLRVRTAIRRFNGDHAAAAKHLGITRQRIQGHVSLIESKGWAV